MGRVALLCNVDSYAICGGGLVLLSRCGEGVSLAMCDRYLCYVIEKALLCVVDYIAIWGK